VIRKGFVAVVAMSGLLALSQPSMAETIHGALARAYQNNASMNSARAGVRITDEGVAIAKSGWRPYIGASGSLNYTSTNNTSRITTGSFGIQIQQSLFDGFTTLNNVRAAEAQVRAANESLRNTEQDILFNAASAYVDVLRDRQIATYRERNLDFLGEQVRAASSRFEVGEGTRTDVAQAQASEAAYLRLVGERPNRLEPAGPVAKLLPGSIDAALGTALHEHPVVKATLHLVDAASFQVKSAEGTMLPQLNAQAGVTHSYRNTESGLPGVGMGTADGSSNSASVGLNLTIPIYQGGLASAQVRQSKESLGQARIEVDVARDQVRNAVTSAWTQYVAAREVVAAGRELVSAAQLALNGVIEERNVGQRTTLDVLNAQADVITAQINVASAERDVVAASYAILSAMGQLSPQRLGLNVAVHNPREHYDAVKNKWIGTKTPDGR
jgi:outer membrane protein